MSPAPVPHASPFTLTLELTRSEKASAPFAFQPGVSHYLRRMEDGSYRDLVLDWDQALLEDLAALERIPPDRGVVQRLGDRLRTFLEQVGWENQEAQLLQALREARPIHITLRFAAAELYALPWELLTLRGRGQHLGELPACTLRYEWLGASCRPPAGGARPAGGRILFAWSAAGGDVPVGPHLRALQRACERAGWPFDEERDVLRDVSIAGLARALSAPGEPVAVLHLLCHGSARGETYGLLWNESPEGRGEQFVDGGALRQVLEAHAGSLRLVVLCACQSGGAGGLGNSLGSVALALHRIGLEAVVASRLPLSVAGSVLLTQVLYERMLGLPDSLEASLVEARARLARDTEGLDWASLQLHAYAEQGFDTRPLIFRPYRSLLPQELEPGRFVVGSQSLAQHLQERVLEAGRGGRPRFQLLVGAAGTGKSTLVRAGLLPSLSPANWDVAWIRPGGSVPRTVTDGAQAEGWPSATLAALTRALRLSPPAGGLPLQAAPEEVLVEAIRQRQQPWSSLLLVVESLEDVFTWLPQAAERQSFVRALWKLSLLEEASVVVLALLREDSLARCGELALADSGPRLDEVASSEDHRLLLPVPQAEQLLRIIERPARQVGLVLEDGLAQVLLREVEHEPDPLSLLTYALDMLWERREGRKLTLRAYADLGGVGGALAWQAERLYQKLGNAEKHAARRLLVALVELRDEAHSHTRRRARLGELRPSEGGERQSAFDRALECFLSARLLTWRQDSENAQGDVWVQVSHEALIRRWELLRRWVHEAAELQGQLRGWQDRAREWTRHREDRDGGASFLLTGEQLDEARRFQARHGEELTPEVTALITASGKRQRRRRRLVRWGVVGLVAGALLVAGRMAALAHEASRQEEAARSSSEKAERLRDQAMEAQARARLESAIALLDEEPARALLLLRSMRNTQVFGSPRWIMAARAVLQQPVSQARLRDRHEQFTSVAFDETGKQVVAGTARGSVLLWSLESGGGVREVARELGTEIRQVGFGARGSQVFALGGTRLRRWSPETPQAMTSGTGASVDLRALSAEGRFAVKLLNSKSWRLILLEEDRELQGWLPSRKDWRQTVLSSDPDRQVLRGVVATTGNGVWLRSERQESGRWLCGPAQGACGRGLVHLIALHPEGSPAATVAEANLVRVWDAGGSERLSLSHSSSIKAVAFSPKNEQLAVGLEDGTVHFWHTRSGRRLAILRGHASAVESIAFDARGEQLVSASRDGTVLLWRMKLEHLPLLLEDGRGSPIEEVAFSPKEDKVVTVSSDGTVRAWPVDPSRKSWVVMKEEGTRVWRVGFSENGEVAVLSSQSGKFTTRLWPGDGQPLSWTPPPLLQTEDEGDDPPDWLDTLDEHSGSTVPPRARLEPSEMSGEVSFRWFALSLAGQLQAGGALADGAAAIMRLDRPIPLQGLMSSVRALAFSPDGRLATTSRDGTVRIWFDNGSEGERLDPSGERSPFAVTWAPPQGNQLAVSGRHGLVYLWRLPDKSPELLPSGHKDEISAMAFGPNGKKLLLGYMDGTALLLPLQLLTAQELQERLEEVSSSCLELDEMELDLSSDEMTAMRRCEPIR